jgi:hypothetical protein
MKDKHPALATVGATVKQLNPKLHVPAVVLFPIPLTITEPNAAVEVAPQTLFATPEPTKEALLLVLLQHPPVIFAKTPKLLFKHPPTITAPQAVAQLQNPPPKKVLELIILFKQPPTRTEPDPIETLQKPPPKKE